MPPTQTPWTDSPAAGESFGAGWEAAGGRAHQHAWHATSPSMVAPAGAPQLQQCMRLAALELPAGVACCPAAALLCYSGKCFEVSCVKNDFRDGKQRGGPATALPCPATATLQLAVMRALKPCAMASHQVWLLMRVTCCCLCRVWGVADTVVGVQGRGQACGGQDH